MPDSAPVTRNRSRRPSLTTFLKSLGACSEALEWAGSFGTDYEAAWNACERGDYLLWACARIGVERPVLVRAAVACVQPAVTAHVPASETRPQAALDAAVRWADDPTPANLDRVRAAADAASAADAAASAAYDAYDSAAASAAAYDAYDAASAADAAASAAAYDAYDAAAYAAEAYADAAAAEARQEARSRSLRESAQIIRSLIPFAVVLAALEVAP